MKGAERKIAMVDARLIEAYRRTDYALFGAGGEETILNIGVPSAAFDRILDRHGAASAVIVTAYNPRSVVLADAENGARHDRLVRLIESKGFRYALGEGRDPSGRWRAELECVVFGISAEQGLELARAFEQNAIVFVQRGEPPALLYPD